MLKPLSVTAHFLCFLALLGGCRAALWPGSTSNAGVPEKHTVVDLTTASFDEHLRTVPGDTKVCLLSCSSVQLLAQREPEFKNVP